MAFHHPDTSEVRFSRQLRKTTSAPVPGGHYQIVTEGNALGYSSMRNLCLEGSTPQDGSVYLGSCLAPSSLQDLFLLSVVKDSKPLYILYNV